MTGVDGFLWGKHLTPGERITVRVKRIRAPYGNSSKWTERGGDKYPMILELTEPVHGKSCVAMTETSMIKIAETGVHFNAMKGGHIVFARNRRVPNWALVVVSVAPPPQQRRMFA